MTNRRITDLPDAEYKSVLEDAKKRAAALLGGVELDGISTFIIGLADIIRELQNEVRDLKKG